STSDVPEDGRVSLGDHHHMSFFGDGHTADVSDLPYSLELSPVIDASRRELIKQRASLSI
ncbi:hypothetical protein Tco_1380552, partial [Tanacetum coccineum]